MKRANFYLLGMASEEGELVSLGVNARPGPTATSPLPERAPKPAFH
jgi:hypothetical protein